MGDDDWVSDTDTVDGDKFNKADFNKVKVKDPNERPELVKGATANFQNYGLPPVYNDYDGTTPAQPTQSANDLQRMREEDERQERLEKEQARALAQQKVSPPPIPAKNFNMEPPPVPQKTVAPPPIPNNKPNAAPPLPNNKPNATNNNYNNANDRFQGNYSSDIVEFFTQMNQKTFTEQAVEFLNAYWDEVGDQAEFIFSVAYKIFTEADMHRQGITLFYQYEEGSNVDYPTYLYFYEKLVKFVGSNPQWRQGQYEKSAVYEVKTAIKHKKDLQEKVDVNFDGQISFLEFLLYQYNTFSNPAQFMERTRMAGDEHSAIVAARLALDEVNARIKAYERERARLEEGAKLPGVQGLTFKHQLAQLDASPLAEELNKALITAEAAVRIAVKKFQGLSGAFGGAGQEGFNPRGALWWMQRDLEEKKKYKRG